MSKQSESAQVTAANVKRARKALTLIVSELAVMERTGAWTDAAESNEAAARLEDLAQFLTGTAS
jgi:hypothetical protein